jgi:sugar/nucleoside kinase (ribokinase family)
MNVPDLIICGSLTLDNVVTADGRLLPRSAGGNVVYAALGAALWGARIGLVSRAGADFPADFLAMLVERSLDLGGVTRLDGAHGMNVAFAYRADGSRVRSFPAALVERIPQAERPRFVDYTSLGVAHRYATWIDFAPDAQDIPSSWRDRVRLAHLAAMPVQRHLSLVGCLRAAQPKAHVQVDSPWYDERALEQNFHVRLLPRLNLLLPSEADLAIWRPALAPMEAAATLARSSACRVLVKRGDAGCVLLAADGKPSLAVPAFPVEAVDPTGAGDSFCGGLLAGLWRYGDLRAAIIAGTATASFTVQAPGTAALMQATPDEIERRFAWIERRTTHYPVTEPIR